MLRFFLPKDSECSGALARSGVPRDSRLILGGHSWYVAPRPRVDGEGPLASAVALPSAWTNHGQRGTTCTRSKLACSASFRETAGAVAR